jgi:ribulose-phosphate 3-epimerase
MIIPAIIPKSLEHLRQTIDRVAFSKTVQIDVVDGKFAPFISWPYEPSARVIDAKEILNHIEAEIDLMVSDPLTAAADWISAGAKALVFHFESLDKPDDAIALAHDAGVKVAFALNNDTELLNLYPFIDSLDFVQLMGIKDIGTQGQPFDNRVLERIATLSALFPDLPISVDGSVNGDTINNLKVAGARRFVVGSAILKSNDPEAKYQELLKIVA